MFVNNTQAHSQPDSLRDQPLQPMYKAKKLVAFGDSNTTPYLAGTTSWFSFLETNMRAHLNYTFTFTNKSVNGTFMSYYLNDQNQNQQYDIQGALNQITYADFGLVMLGSNDASVGIDVGVFQTYYEQFITTVKNSRKIGMLYVLAVPPMIYPYNCLGPTCWNNTHNPQTERVVPYNTYLSTIASRCAIIGFRCKYINTSNGIQLNTTYLFINDGIHLLNIAQSTVSNNIYAVISKDIVPPCQTFTNMRCISTFLPLPVPKKR